MSRRVLLRQTLKAIAALFVGGSLLRIVNGEPIDRGFIAGFLGGSVVLLLCMVFLVPVLSPHLVSNREFFSAVARRVRGRGGTSRDDTRRDQL